MSLALRTPRAPEPVAPARLAPPTLLSLDAEVRSILCRVLGRVHARVESATGHRACGTSADLLHAQTLLRLSGCFIPDNEVFELGVLLGDVLLRSVPRSDWWVELSNEALEPVVRYHQSDVVLRPIQALQARIGARRPIDLVRLYRELYSAGVQQISTLPATPARPHRAASSST